MEKRIDLERRGRSADLIKEICLDNCRSQSIVGLDDSFCNLEVLSMINIGLTSLKNFPKLPKLKRLELSDNRISNGLEHLANSPELEYLNLCGNRFKDLDSLEPLNVFTKLEILDLFNCEVTEVEGYRSRVFELLPNLKYLDGYDKNNKEIEDEDENEDENDDDDDDENDAEDDDENAAGVGEVDAEDDEEDEEDGDDGVEDGADDGEEDDEEDDDDGAEDDEEDDEEGDEEDEQVPGNLADIYKEQDEEDEDEEDFAPGENDDDEDDDIDDEEEEEEDALQTSKGEKRKLGDDGDVDDDDADE